MRLDQYLVKHQGLYSRNKAQEMIRDGQVTVDGNIVRKTAYQVEVEDAVMISSDEQYVSRAALKLKHFLPLLPFEVKEMKALDIGASTGGFTQLLLESGVTHVTAVDVGTDQLHSSLRKDGRVTSIEQMDIRSYVSQERFELVVSDVSFISLSHILEDIDRLASRWIILLFKPQFEVGREVKRDKNGVVQDKKAIAQAMMRFEDDCQVRDWQLQAKEVSALSGKEGNIEYCYCYRKDR